MTRSISESVDSPAGDTPSEYQKGALSAREFLQAALTHAASIDPPAAASAADTPDNPEQQR